MPEIQFCDCTPILIKIIYSLQLALLEINLFIITIMNQSINAIFASKFSFEIHLQRVYQECLPFCCSISFAHMYSVLFQVVSAKTKYTRQFTFIYTDLQIFPFIDLYES